MKKKFTQQGIGLVEVVIGLAIVTAAVVALVLAYGIFLRSASSQGKAVKAEFLLEEGAEAVRSIRDSGWSTISNLSTGTAYDISFNGSLWEVATAGSPIDGEYYRTVVFENVYRDASDDIAVSGALDPLSRKLTVSVSWPSRSGTTTSSIETYIADIFINQ